MAQDDACAPGLSSSMWATAPRGYNTNGRSRRWDTPHAYDYQQQQQQQQQPLSSRPNDAGRTSSQPPPSSHRDPSSSFHPATYRPPAPSKDITPAQALHRLEQTCLRLRWKSLDLEASYARVMRVAEQDVFAPQVAERNFKIDFYEFYAWIEQAVELLHRVFGVHITSARGGPSWSSGSAAPHAFHHNVLKALGEEDNPLHEVMGRGEVNAALWKAKELRNRWKEGGEDVPLGMYDLKWIVGRVLEGLEGGYGKARERVDALGGQEVDAGGGGGNDEENWEWMVGESMDLDEV